MEAYTEYRARTVKPICLHIETEVYSFTITDAIELINSLASTIEKAVQEQGRL